jgi:hypothetical protein
MVLANRVRNLAGRTNDVRVSVRVWGWVGGGREAI